MGLAGHDSRSIMKKARIRVTENAHILLWLIKDTCWVLDQRLLGVCMIVPTILVAVYLTARTRTIREEFIHNLAVVFWLCANSVWMIGEFYYDDHTRPFALVFFALGLLTLTVHYVPLWLLKSKPRPDDPSALEGKRELL